MTQKQINQILGKRQSFIYFYLTSEDARACFFTAVDALTSTFIKTKTDIVYNYRQPLLIKDVNLVKERIKYELANIEKIETDGSIVKIGKVELKAENDTLPIELDDNYRFYNLSEFNIPRLEKYSSTDATRCFMNGVFFAKNGDCVATDGRRMAVQKTTLKFDDFIVSRQVFKFFEKSKYLRLEYYPKSKTCVFSDDEKTIYTECIDGRFPNYQRVIPQYELKPYEIDFDYKKHKKLIESFSKKLPKVSLYGNDIYCEDYKVGSTNLNSDFVVFDANFLNDIIKDTSKNCDISGGSQTKACVFGDENFKVICMPCIYGAESDYLPPFIKNQIA